MLVVVINNCLYLTHKQNDINKARNTPLKMDGNFGLVVLLNRKFGKKINEILILKQLEQTSYWYQNKGRNAIT